MKATVLPAVNGSRQIKDTSQPQTGSNYAPVKIHAIGIFYTDTQLTLVHFARRFSSTANPRQVRDRVARDSDTRCPAPPPK
jgi:hypothetical protein